MAIDSTAELLFNITANADDGQENIARFRALMGQDLDSMAAQFTDWSDEVVGKIDSVKAAMTAGLAAIAAGVLSAGVAIGEATKDYMSYADEVGHAMKVTGLSAESLSSLHSAAAKTGVNFDTLSTGLVRFEENVVKASQGSKEQLGAFAALGISQKEVIAGQTNLLPLLLKTMDGFHGNASAVQKAALARELFSRQGPEMLALLSKSSEWLKENGVDAQSLGLILSNKDVIAAREFKLAQKELAEQGEALAVTVGKHVVPMLEKFESSVIAGVAAIKQFAKGGIEGFKAPLVFLKEYGEEMAKIKKTVEAAGSQADVVPIVSPDTTGKIQEAKTEFQGLVSLVESMKDKIAEQGTGWDRLTQEVAHYHVEIDKATADLAKLQKAGTITPESLRASQAALAQIPTLLAKVVGETTLKLTAADQEAWLKTLAKAAEGEAAETAIVQKAGEDRLDVTRQIQEKESTAGEQSYAEQRVQLQRQMADWAAAMAKKTELTAGDWNAIDKITAEGLAKIDRTETTGWQEQLRKLQEHLDQATAANATAQQKLALEYQKELEQYSQVEEQKVLKTAQSEAQVTQIMQMYGQIRTQITQKYQDDLQKLLDSKGFQGIFGSYFGSMIKQNSDLWHQWAQSSNQSLLLVKVSLQSLQQQAQKTFQSFIQGMGQSIAQAIVMKTSIVQAMEQMLKSTLASFAGQAITAALMATAWGFYDLALGMDAQATAAFTAAAIFGTVGAAAAVAGRLIPSASGAGGSGSGSASGGSAVGAGGVSNGAGSGGGGQQQPNVYINVAGSVIGPSGAAQLCDIINQAVYGNNAQLYASHSPSGVPL